MKAEKKKLERLNDQTRARARPSIDPDDKGHAQASPTFKQTNVQQTQFNIVVNGSI